MTRPIELYKIAIDADAYTWTSGDAEVSYLGDTYTPAPITHSPIEQTQEINRANIRLTVPRTNPVGLVYLGFVPDYPASVTIYRQTDAGTTVLWKGRVAGASGSGSEILIDCENVFSSLRQIGLRARYQKNCRHAHYRRGCWLDHANFAVPGEASAVSSDGLTVTVAVAAAEADGWYNAGMFEFEGVLRHIVRHTGSSLTLWRPHTGLANAVANDGYGKIYGMWYGRHVVTLYPGCDRSRATCNDKFNNLPNQGGFAWLPKRSPMNGASIV